MDCERPITIYIESQRTYETVPCGKCLACQANRRKAWSLRLQCEWDHSVQSYTVTLTYDDFHLPSLDVYQYYDHDTLVDYLYHPINYRDVQLFFKRLRKSVSFRYFGIAEYGTERQRPHYHIIFFFSDSIDLARFTSLVLAAWTDEQGALLGQRITVEPTNGKCIGYCSKYCLKLIDHECPTPPPKSFMSLKPGIGYQFMSHDRINYLHEKFTDVTKIQGFKQQIPRFFKDRIFSDHQKSWLSILASENDTRQEEYIERYAASDDAHPYESARSVSRTQFNRRIREQIKNKSIK